MSSADRDTFRTEVRTLLAERLAPRPGTAGPITVLGAGSDEVEEGRRYLASLAEVGLSTPGWPVHLGGRGAPRWQIAILDEELRAFTTADLYPFGVGTGLVGPTLLTHGTPEQQQRWMPRIGTGADIWCQLFSEPGAGSDLAGLATKAVSDGDVWHVDGQKVWCSRGHYANWGFLLARTDPDVPKHAGITAFAVPMDAPGVEVRPMRQMNGDAHFSEVFLDDLQLPDANRIGAVGDGWKVAITVLAHERAGIGAGGATQGGGGLRRNQE
ncbi:MAG: acyl-CoA dehydrogenase family protein, partial [Acidimicrobiia bacterium]